MCITGSRLVSSKPRKPLSPDETTRSACAPRRRILRKSVRKSISSLAAPWVNRYFVYCPTTFPGRRRSCNRCAQYFRWAATIKCRLRFGHTAIAFLSASGSGLSQSLQPSSSVQAVGDLVAQGVGLTRDAVSSYSASATSAAVLSSVPSNATATATLPSWAASGSDSVVVWPSVQNDDQCWAQWNSYWSEPHNVTSATTFIPTKTSATTMTNIVTFAENDGWTITTTRTLTKVNGGFVQSQASALVATTQTVAQSSYPAKTFTNLSLHAHIYDG